MESAHAEIGVTSATSQSFGPEHTVARPCPFWGTEGAAAPGTRTSILTTDDVAIISMENQEDDRNGSRRQSAEQKSDEPLPWRTDGGDDPPVMFPGQSSSSSIGMLPAIPKWQGWKSSVSAWVVKL